MVLLHDRVEAPLADLGYREEHRRFQSHLTIGRVRGGPAGKIRVKGDSPILADTKIGTVPLFPADGIAELGNLLQQQADFLAGRMTVGKVTVFSSTLTPAGPIYEVLDRARLGS